MLDELFYVVVNTGYVTGMIYGTLSIGTAVVIDVLLTAFGSVNRILGDKLYLVSVSCVGSCFCLGIVTS